MAGNNLLHFLRGGLGNATDETLEPGQPFYNYKKNYLTIGGNKDTKVNGKPLTVREVVGYKADNDNITSGTDGEFHLKYSNSTLELLTPDNFKFKSGESEVATYSSDNSGTIALHKPISSSYSATYSSLTINGNTNCQTCLPSSSNTYNLGSSEKSFKTLYVNNLGTTLKPSSDNSYDLGSSSKKFKTLYVGDVLASSIQNNSDITIKTTTSSAVPTPSITLSGSSPIITINGTIRGGNLDIGEFSSPIGTVYANAIKSETIDKINERLNELGFKSGNLTYNNVNIGKIARLGKVAYGYLCASDTTITESSTIIYQEIYSVNGVLSDNSVLPEDIVGKTFSIYTFTASADLIISSYTDTVDNKRLVYHSIRLNRGEINLRHDIKYTFWVATDSFDILLK